jgi:type IV secretory pathway VirB9-like protein
MKPTISLLALLALGACGHHEMAECSGPLFAFNAGTWQPAADDLVAPKGETTDAELSGVTVEQGGVVKIHGVYPAIRLRQGDRVLCVWNRAYSPIGNNPGTGTTNAGIERAVGQKASVKP